MPLADGSRDLTQEILDLLSEKEKFKTEDQFPNVPPREIKAAIDRLKSRQMVAYNTIDNELVLLTPEGQEICENGSHEYKVWKAIKDHGKLELPALEKEIGNKESTKVGLGNAMKNKWVKKDGQVLVPAVAEVQDKTREVLESVRDTSKIGDAKTLAEYKKRKLVKTEKAIAYEVERDTKYAREIPVEHTELTAELLQSGAWKTATFKPYNFKAEGAAQGNGALHPLLQVRKELRNIFFQVGFTEMPTNRFVESGFWNFDALFVPQQHPARDLQDTFYVSDPPEADRPGPDPDTEAIMEKMEASNDKIFRTQPNKEPRDYSKYWDAIKAVHEDGGDFSSRGYRYPWSEKESRRLVLRTHTTAMSAWVLHRLAQSPRPAKYFSIDRVFRNETVDATHLAEFFQVEGVIAEWDLSLGDGMGFLEYFYGQLGISPLRFKPAYNPYTEPSMEVFGFHAGLNKWIEIGNSGVFRPEMLEPMGIPKRLRVYGFGLSVERPTMIRYGIRNIRDLVGHKCDIGFIQGNPAVRLDK